MKLLVRFEELIRQFAKDVSRVKLIKIIMLPLWRPLRMLLDYHAIQNNTEINRNFREKGLKSLKDFTDVLDSIGVNYTLAFGTMLGAIREHGFIKHDLDIDIMIWISEYSEKIPNSLREVGFTLEKRYTIDNRETGYEETYKRDGIGVDLFYLYPQHGKYPYCCDFLTFPDCASIRISVLRHGGLMARKLELPYIRERQKVKFENIEVYVPQNAHEILRFRYGDDYMIPNAKWGIKSFDKHITIMEGKVGIYEEFK